MADIENGRPRGRPRGFDLSAAVQVGQHLFHERGYDNVSIATLTEAIGITPPSFYAAFGSKDDFFEEALRLYSATVVPLDRILTPCRSPEAALAEMLDDAAHAYAAHPQRRGCFILEHARNGAAQSNSAAGRIVAANRDRLHAFLAASGIDTPDLAADYVAATMLGLSAAAREGWDEPRLKAVAEAAKAGFDRLLSRDKSSQAR